MSTDKNFGTVATQQSSSALTTSYGTDSAGWTTKGIDVSGYDSIAFELDYGDHDSASTLSLKPFAGDQTSADLDAYVQILEDPLANGSLSALEFTRSVSDDEKGLLTIDTRGISKLRLAAKVNNATGAPTLSVRILGSRREIRGLENATPSVS